MGSKIVLVAVITMLLLANKTWVGAGELVNGSFEDDLSIDDISLEEPNGWTDVNLPADQFYGWVDRDWATDGRYNLSLCSWFYTGFEVDDVATVSQLVTLADVNEIRFDVKLETYATGGGVWDPAKRTAVLMIDDVPVWESNDVGPDVAGEYPGQTVEISFNDSAMHKLSLGLRADVNETSIEADTVYYVYWDSIVFDFKPPLIGDFDDDYDVDACDLGMLLDLWADEVAADSKYNLYNTDDPDPNGIINFCDFTIFAKNWQKRI